jgi:predicted RND superfamily exporter protein
MYDINSSEEFEEIEIIKSMHSDIEYIENKINDFNNCYEIIKTSLLKTIDKTTKSLNINIIDIVSLQQACLKLFNFYIDILIIIFNIFTKFPYLGKYFIKIKKYYKSGNNLLNKKETIHEIKNISDTKNEILNKLDKMNDLFNMLSIPVDENEIDNSIFNDVDVFLSDICKDVSNVMAKKKNN